MIQKDELSLKLSQGRMHKVTITWQKIIMMPTFFGLISDQKKARYFKVGALSNVANLYIPLKQSTHCSRVEKDLKYVKEGWGDQKDGEK